MPTWGATIAGCRRVLIAYNVNLLATKEQAHRIALNVREQGRGPAQPGRFLALQACGWLLAEHNIGSYMYSWSAHRHNQNDCILF